jgi:hypothetical protein
MEASAMQLTRRSLGGGALALLAGCVTRQSAVPAARPIDVAAIDRRRILRAAAGYLGDTPATITAFRAARSPGGPHDYYSEGDYWWPDPANPDGPYVRRDGFSNPARFDDHRQALIGLGLRVPALVAAWSVTRDARYAAAAARHLNAWFVAPETRMNPHLDHAQAIIGLNTGRGIGVIDTLQLVEVARAADRLRETGYPLDPAVTGWFGDYLTWLTTSPNGTDERDEKNNHGSCWLLQAAEFARLAGENAVRAGLRDRFRTVLMPQQIAPDGSQPLELARTKPFGYCLFNLDVLAAAAHSLSTPDDDLWRFATPDGRSLAAALAFMAPFIADKASWPFARDVEYWDDWPVRHPSLLFGGLALSRPEYIALWRGLDPDPAISEIIRNYPIRQPVLWL